MSGILISDLALNAPKLLSNEELQFVVGGMTDIYIHNADGTITHHNDGVNNGVLVKIDLRPSAPIILQ